MKRGIIADVKNGPGKMNTGKTQYTCGRLTLKHTQCVKIVSSPGTPCAQHRSNGINPAKVVADPAVTPIPANYAECRAYLSGPTITDAQVWTEVTAEELYRRLAAAEHPCTGESQLRYLSDDAADVIRSAIASRKDCPIDALETLATDPECAAVILRKQRNPAILERALKHGYSTGVPIIVTNVAAPARIIYSIIRTALQAERQAQPVATWTTSKKDMWTKSLKIMASRQDCPEHARYNLLGFIQRELSPPGKGSDGAAYQPDHGGV